VTFSAYSRLRRFLFVSGKSLLRLLSFQFHEKAKYLKSKARLFSEARSGAR
jgi:hypothetical protein